MPERRQAPFPTPLSRVSPGANSMEPIAILKVLFGLAVLVGWPGVVVGWFGNIQKHFDGWPRFAIVIGTGFATTIVVGTLAAILGVPPWITIVALVAFCAALSLRHWQHGLLSASSFPVLTGARLSLLSVIVLMLVLVIMIDGVRTIARQPEPLSGVNADSWHYMTVIQDYYNDPEPFKLLDSPPIMSVNARLFANGWLYLESMLVQFTGVELTHFFIKYYAEILLLLSLVSLYSLAVTLGLPKGPVALLATGAQAAFWSSLWPSQSLLRLSEDKYAAAFVLYPVAISLLVVTMETRNHRLLGLAALFSLATAMMHPLQLPVILVVFLPYVGLRWLLTSDQTERRWLLLFGTVITVPIIYTALMRIALTSSSDSIETRLRHVSTIARASDWRDPTEQRVMLLKWQTQLALVLLPVVLVDVWRRARRGLYLVISALVLGFFLYTWPGTAVMGKLVTFNLLPRLTYYFLLGFVVVWGGYAIGRWLWLYTGKSESRQHILWPIAMSAAALFIVAWIIWPHSHNRTTNALKDDFWAAHVDTAIVDSSRVIVPYTFAARTPVTWPDADILYSPKEKRLAIDEKLGIEETLTLTVIRDFYENPTAETLDILVTDFYFDYILTPNEAAFVDLLVADFYPNRYENPSYVLWGTQN